MSSTSDSEMELTPDIIRKEAQNIIEDLLPQKSKERYIKSYNDFMKWRSDKKVKSLSESVFLTYFNDLSKRVKPSTLWSVYSMLKTTMTTRHNVNLKNFDKLTSFLKRQSEGFRSKKSKVLTAQDVETFLNQAPDEVYLATKVGKNHDLYKIPYYCIEFVVSILKNCLLDKT